MNCFKALNDFRHELWPLLADGGERAHYRLQIHAGHIFAAKKLHELIDQLHCLLFHLFHLKTIGREDEENLRSVLVEGLQMQSSKLALSHRKRSSDHAQDELKSCFFDTTIGTAS